MSELWPEFSPDDFPLVVYDGQRTLMFRHPSPPQEFVAVEGQEGVLAYDGRHPAVVANSSARIAGVETATVLSGDRPEVDAIIAHETFHLFCHARHPHWNPNEVDGLGYPVEDADALAGRYLEGEALRRALTGDTDDAVRGWAAMFLAVRLNRAARLPERAMRYERELERFEGLASFVGRSLDRTVGTPARLDELTAEFPADDVRGRAYLTGESLAVLLGRIAPGWAYDLERDDTRYLDDLLAAALESREALEACPARDFEPAERSAKADLARARVGELVAERRRIREAFAADGARVVIEADGEDPLQVTLFDPSMVRRLDDLTVLHERILGVRGSGIAVEMSGVPAITEAVDAENPLFGGVRRVIFAPPAGTGTEGGAC